MERLTKWNESLGRYTLKDGCARGTAGKVNRVLGEYEDTGLAPEQIRELDKLYAELCEELAKYRWIPVEERLPEDDNYILLSFANFSIPMIGRYEKDEEGGGAFYLGDCDEEDTCVGNELFVNAWMPLSEPYGREE